ncbi:MAG: MgtC/SapB family protein [Cyanobacterium sp. T60_A2020_053]|nr:MgtC/SapB family protein [Cyanobacterium sp. T60_A2020_053]
MLVFIKLFLALILGSLLGLERELSNKPGGVKTHGLVALASCGFILIVQEISIMEQARVMTGIIQGVGFIGGGLIVKEGNNAKGLTGAVEIWISSGLGLACAFGLWRIAFNMLFLSLLLLKLMRLSFPKS